MTRSRAASASCRFACAAAISVGFDGACRLSSWSLRLLRAAAWPVRRRRDRRCRPDRTAARPVTTSIAAHHMHGGDEPLLGRPDLDEIRLRIALPLDDRQGVRPQRRPQAGDQGERQHDENENSSGHGGLAEALRGSAKISPRAAPRNLKKRRRFAAPRVPKRPGPPVRRAAASAHRARRRRRDPERWSANRGRRAGSAWCRSTIAGGYRGDSAR